MNSLESEVTKEKERTKRAREEAQTILNGNIDLRQLAETRATELKEKNELIERAEKAASEATTQLALLTDGWKACMKAAKDSLDAVFVGASGSAGGELPEASPEAFGEWFKAKGWACATLDRKCC